MRSRNIVNYTAPFRNLARERNRARLKFEVQPPKSNVLPSTVDSLAPVLKIEEIKGVEEIQGVKIEEIKEAKPDVVNIEPIKIELEESKPKEADSKGITSKKKKKKKKSE